MLKMDERELHLALDNAKPTELRPRRVSAHVADAADLLRV